MEMFGQSAARFPRPGKNRPRPRGTVRQAAIALAALAGVLGLAAFATSRYGFLPSRHPAVSLNAGADAEIYTGSILYMPDSTSDVCHQMLFDNKSGQFTDKGSVDCQDAENNALDGPRQWSSARIKVISNGFRGH